jgi:hypothetical protein
MKRVKISKFIITISVRSKAQINHPVGVVGKAFLKVRLDASSIGKTTKAVSDSTATKI